MTIHTKIASALAEGSSWAAIGAALGTLGSQLPAPYSFYSFASAAFAGVLAILLKDKGQA